MEQMICRSALISGLQIGHVEHLQLKNVEKAEEVRSTVRDFWDGASGTHGIYYLQMGKMLACFFFHFRLFSGRFLNWWYPQIIHLFIGFSLINLSILGAHPYFWKYPEKDW